MSKTFQIYGQEIFVNDRYDLYNGIRQRYEKFAEEAAEKFLQEYKGYGDIDRFAERGYADGAHIIIETIETSVINTLIQEYNVHHIDKDLFISKYYGKYFVWEEYSNKIIDKYMEIKLGQEELDAYRTHRRENRGRVIGGGFGVGGAVEGMMKAGAMNIAAGAAHGAFNLIGKGFSMIGASIEKSNLYDAQETKTTLYTGIFRSVFFMHHSFWEMMNDLNLIPVKEGAIPYLSEAERNKAASILKNMPKMDEEKIASLFPEVLLSNPYDDNMYRTMLRLMGDQKNELIEIGSYFGHSVATLKNNMLNELFKKLSPEHTDSEDEVLQARETFQKEYDRLGDTESGQQHLAEIDAILAEKDLAARTVDGFVFDTREESAKARTELGAVHKALEGFDYTKTETDAKTVLHRLSSCDQNSLIVQKYTVAVKEKLTAFDIEARTSDGILFDTRGEKHNADSAFKKIDELKKENLLDEENVSALIKSITIPLFAQSSQRSAFYAKIGEHLWNMDDEELALCIRRVIVSEKSTPDSADATKELLAIAEKKLLEIDEKIRTVICRDNRFVFETRQEADKVRGQAEALEAAYKKYSSSPDEKEIFLDLLGAVGTHQDVQDIYRKLNEQFLNEQNKIILQSEVKTSGDFWLSLLLYGLMAFVSFIFIIKGWNQWSWFGKKTIVGFIFVMGVGGTIMTISEYRKTRKAIQYQSK